MPRRSIVPAAFDESMPMTSNHHKKERSHEENQERAYIAASRRTDRCLEARVQSAHMASEIHKKRTGRGFKITKEIVLNEEMYEEENDNLPRSHHLLGVYLQTPSADVNIRTEAELSKKFEVSKMLAKANREWRENYINGLFAQSFPNALPPAHQETQMTPGAAASQYYVEAHSATASAPISYPPEPGVTAQPASCHISASTTHHRQATRYRRWSCTSSSPKSSSCESSLQATSKLPNSSSPGTISTTEMTASIERTTSLKISTHSTSPSRTPFPSEFASTTPTLSEVGANALIVPTLVNQEILEPEALSNSPMLHALSEMPDVTQMSQVDSGSVPYDDENAADETNACIIPTPPNSDYDPWQAFINDTIWVADSQQ